MPKKTLLLALTIILSTSACESYLIGDNSQGQLGVSDTSANAYSVDVGDPWVLMEAGTVHTCGITTTKELWCWGDNSRGQTGNNSTGGDQLTPVKVGTGADWTSVAPGYRHTCGIRAGQMWCWGSDNFGQLGNGTTTTSSTGSPVRVGTDSDWTMVTAGWYHSCGLRDNGYAYCWGSNSSGELGLGNRINQDVPARIITGPWKDIDAGRNHTCAVRTDGVTNCWGSNSNGQIGTSSVAIGADRLSPIFPVNSPSALFGGDPLSWKSVTAGDFFSCGVLSDNTIACWGRNDYGQIPSSEVGVDVQTAVRSDFVTRIFLESGEGELYINYYGSLSAGGDHLCGVKTRREYHVSLNIFADPPPWLLYSENDDQEVKCFGRNDNGQLWQAGTGIDSTTDLDVSVSAGLRHTVVLGYEE